MMRMIIALAAAVMLAACSSGPDVAEEVDEQVAGQGRELAEIPENIYQPTVHAILALSGGFEADGPKETIETVWHRAGTEQLVRLQLSPDEVTVKALNAGRYVLDRMVVDGRELLVTGDDGITVSPVSDVVLDPGDVIYAGDLVIRDRAGNSSSTARKLVLRIEKNSTRAREAVAATYSRQASQMKTQLLRKR